MRYLKLYGLRFVRRLLKGIQFDEDCKLEIDYRFVTATGRYEINIFNPFSKDRLFISLRITKFEGQTYIVHENFDKQLDGIKYSSYVNVLDSDLETELESFSLTL